MIKKLLAVVICIGSVKMAQAQPLAVDTVAFEKKVLFVIDHYNKNIGEQAEIYNGLNIISSPRATKGTPYLENQFEFTNNSIKYNGTWYSNVPVLYDTYKDVLVATQPQNQAKYILHEKYLTEFFLFGHHFVHYDAIDNNKGKLNEGYYDQLYKGKTLVISKLSKTRTETVSTQGVEVIFDDKQSFYINKGGHIYNVSSKGSVLNVFKDKKKELNIYLSRNNINYNENKGLIMAKLAAYYDQISN